MFWKSIINNLRYNAFIHSNNKLDSKKLEKYLLLAIHSRNSVLSFKDVHSLRISDVVSVGRGFINSVYSFSLYYTEKDEEKQLPLIIKTYGENIDPVRRARAHYIHNQDLRMCIREWQVLRSLEHIGFAVPKAYFYECDSQILGNPFLIMAKVERSKNNSADYIINFAKTLSHLHNINFWELDLKAIKPPEDGYEFAKRWPIHFKHVLNIETKHHPRFKRYFDIAINWLESNISNNYCPKYSLIHGDSHPGNVFLTADLQTTLGDWDSVDIGDPALDVSNAYHTIKFFSNPKDPDSAEQLAEHFLSEYFQKSKVDIRSRLQFYQVVTILGYSIASSSGISSPIMAYKYHQRKVLKSLPFLKLPFILFAFPFLNWSFMARQINAENDLYWLKYFENYMKKLNLI